MNRLRRHARSLQMSLLDLVRSKASTAIELRQKLDQIRASDPWPRQRELELGRKRLLVDGADDKQVDRVESQIAAQLRLCERYDVAVDDLQKRLQQAEVAETREALDRERDQAEAEAQAVA